MEGGGYWEDGGCLELGVNNYYVNCVFVVARALILWQFT